MIERRHPTPRKGERLVGYHPVPGRMLDAKGALLLVYQFASATAVTGAKATLDAEQRALQRDAEGVLRASLLASVTTRKVLRRGGLKAEEPTLL